VTLAYSCVLNERHKKLIHPYNHTVFLSALPCLPFLSQTLRYLLQIDFLLCDVNQVQQQQRLQADTVIMNPPFGTKMKGADMAFLRAAASLQPKQIYSLNKSSTRSHIQKVALK
jgi:predicted RNA methylase